MSKEMGCLFQGFHSSTTPEHTVQGTDTCQFIKSDKVPQAKKATYIRIVAKIREQKADPFCDGCTVGENLINFHGDKSTTVAELVTIKCLLNNIVSMPNAQAVCIDLKDFYLNNDLPTPEYVFFKREMTPKEFLHQYWDKISITTDGYIFARVTRGMYGLP
jgi:hypothetical protein